MKRIVALIAGCLLTAHAASLTLTGPAMLNSYAAPSAAGLWTVNLSMDPVRCIPSVCSFGLQFSDPGGDALGPANRTIQLSVVNTTNFELLSLMLGTAPSSILTFAPGGPASTDHYGFFYRIPDYSFMYFRSEMGPPIPWLPGQTMTVTFTLTGSAPLSAFSLSVSPGSSGLPEPSSMAMCLLGAAAISAARKWGPRRRCLPKPR